MKQSISFKSFLKEIEKDSIFSHTIIARTLPNTPFSQKETILSGPGSLLIPGIPGELFNKNIGLISFTKSNNTSLTLDTYASKSDNPIPMPQVTVHFAANKFFKQKKLNCTELDFILTETTGILIQDQNLSNPDIEKLRNLIPETFLEIFFFNSKTGEIFMINPENKNHEKIQFPESVIAFCEEKSDEQIKSLQEISKSHYRNFVKERFSKKDSFVRNLEKLTDCDEERRETLSHIYKDYFHLIESLLNEIPEMKEKKEREKNNISKINQYIPATIIELKESFTLSSGSNKENDYENYSYE